MKLLCLSGGGYLGLFTASVLMKIEEENAHPIGRYFDLIAGTSVGGLLALAVANEVPMTKVVKAMLEEGPGLFGHERPKAGLAGLMDLGRNILRPKYSGQKLRALVTSLIPENVLIGDLKHRVLVPSVNVTKGSPQVFKTGHHPTFVRDPKIPVLDAALATSAAPSFFPMHTIGSERFVDGGLYANSPDILALHEATHFLNAKETEVSLLSIGTTSTKFSMSGSTPSELGWLGWMREQRLISVMVSSQQMMSDYVMRHKLGDRYLRIDQTQSKEQERELSLDTASEIARKDLQGLAEAAFRDNVVKPQFKSFFIQEADPFGG